VLHRCWGLDSTCRQAKQHWKKHQRIPHGMSPLTMSLGKGPILAKSCSLHAQPREPLSCKAWWTLNSAALASQRGDSGEVDEPPLGLRHRFIGTYADEEYSLTIDRLRYPRSTGTRTQSAVATDRTPDWALLKSDMRAGRSRSKSGAARQSYLRTKAVAACNAAGDAVTKHAVPRGTATPDRTEATRPL
jgi:hypothetical protein